ncbi:serine protease [Azospirillum sp. TSO22-1]|uniref:S1 family peptidase n=1 Tax=Azospirillum sp. TSO22-1 TaxID=716789 RepID=UPI001304AE13|nr:serine protease [Azospirillum sp. TSO22-1]
MAVLLPVLTVAAACDPAPSEPADVARLLHEREDRNRALEQRAAELKAALDSDPCPPGRDAAGPVPVQEATLPPGKPLAREALVRRLEAATVLVLAPPMTGSGFFVTPDTIITNRHVVEKVEDGDVIVIGKAVPQPLRAQVLAMSPPTPEGSAGRDYAILRVDGGRAAQTLSIATAVTPLEEVVAAGFPGLLLSNDSRFQALLNGDLAAIPDLALSRGEVMAVQNRDHGFATIAHSAQISSGSSGGPLTDRCGRVVGINTFMTVDAKESSKAGFALAGADLAAFIAERGLRLPLADGPCRD